MILATLSQSEIERSIRLLVTNGQLPHVQAVIAPVGFGPEGLQRLADLLTVWRANQTTIRLRLLTQKRARQQRDTIRRQLEQEMSAFKGTVRAIFGDDEKLQRFLEVRPPRWNSGGRHSNGASGADNGSEATGARRSGQSESLAACLKRGRTLFANPQHLTEAQQARLAAAGWRPHRLAAAAALVEALAAADGNQKKALVAHRSQQTTTKRLELDLRKVYKEARQLIRLAINQAELDNKKRFKELIGL